MATQETVVSAVPVEIQQSIYHVELLALARSFAEAALHYAPLATAIAVVVSLGVGIFQIKAMNRRQREQTARTIWTDFVKTLIANPVFAYPDRFSADFDFTNELIQQSAERFEQYEWYVAIMFVACREISETLGHDRFWRMRIHRTLQYHASYFVWRIERMDSPEFLVNSGEKIHAHLVSILKDHERLKDHPGLNARPYEAQNAAKRAANLAAISE